MSVTTCKVYDDALSLPADMRMELVEKLLTSLNVPTREEIDRYWAQEAERRVAEIENGEVELTPVEEVLERIRRRYQQ